MICSMLRVLTRHMDSILSEVPRLEDVLHEAQGHDGAPPSSSERSKFNGKLCVRRRQTCEGHRCRLLQPTRRAGIVLGVFQSSYSPCLVWPTRGSRVGFPNRRTRFQSKKVGLNSVFKVTRPSPTRTQYRTYPSQCNRSSITRGAVGHSIPLVLRGGAPYGAQEPNRSDS